MAKMTATAKKTVTREAYETALKSYVQNDNQAGRLAALRDVAMEPINNKFDPLFKKLMDENEAHFAVVQAYMEDNRDEIFVGVKSIEEFGAHVGFREGKDKVIILDGFKEKDIVAVMQKRKAMLPYVRMTPSMDKVKIIKECPKGTEKLGFKVGKEELFFLEPVKTED